MIIKTLKKWSHQKAINQVLRPKRYAISQTKINSIGVLVNLDEFDTPEQFKTLPSILSTSPISLTLIGFSESKKPTNSSPFTHVTPKNIGWNNHIKDLKLQSFIDTQFDILIGFYKHPKLELDMITAFSKSSFKIGVSNHDLRLFDLVIDVPPSNFTLFASELKKYMLILQKI